MVSPARVPPQQTPTDRSKTEVEAEAQAQTALPAPVPRQQTLNGHLKTNVWGNFPMHILRLMTRRPRLTIFMAACIAVTVAGFKTDWLTWGPWLWGQVTLASKKVEPYANILRPLHDMFVVTAAVVFGFFQFVTKRNLKHKLDQIQQAMKAGEDQPWLLEKPTKRSQTKRWSPFGKPASDERDTKYLCIYNQKGGVGKTMLAMNLAAYLDRNNDVLLLDMDYQGSLSSAMLAACEIRGSPSQINELFDEEERPDPYDVINKATSLHWTRAIIESEKKEKLPRTKIITCHYPFLKLENQLTMRWLVEDDFEFDLRYRVADVVRTQAVRKKFDVVIFDCPPRLTMGTINALCASTHLIIPTILDFQSAPPVDLTLQSLKDIKRRLNDDLKLLGVVGNRNYNRNAETLDDLVPAEKIALNTVKQALAGAVDTWGQGRVFQKAIPRVAAVTRAVGEDVPYLADRKFSTLFNQLGDEIADALGLRRSQSSTNVPNKSVNGGHGADNDQANRDRAAKQIDSGALLSNVN
jgi:cellulose biosynthesis protein BcsQ